MNWSDTGIDTNEAIDGVSSPATFAVSGDPSVISDGRTIRVEAEEMVKTADGVGAEAVDQAYEEASDDYNSGGSATWFCQTFTPSVSGLCSSVTLLLYKASGSSPGTVTVSIRATSGGEPTGEDIAGGTTDGNTLPEGSPYEWRNVVFDTPVTLAAGTEYAIVFRSPSDGLRNRHKNSGAYAGGVYFLSSDGGSTWSSMGASDLLFREYCTPRTVSVTRASPAAHDAGKDIYLGFLPGGSYNKLLRRIVMGLPLALVAARWK